MKFSVYRFQMLVNEELPGKEYFELIEQKYKIDSVFEYNEYYYILKYMELNNNYFAIKLMLGNGSLYSPEVVDKTKKILGKNPKKRNQVEPNSELFIIYVFSREDLLLSSYSMRGLVKDILRIDNENIVIKNKFVDFDTFAKKISTLSEVKLYMEDSLFRNEEPLTRELDNALGFGSSTQYEIKAKLKERVNSDVIQKLKNLCQKKSSGQIKNLICIGEDDKGITTCLNNDTFNKKITIEVETDENGHHDYGEVISNIKKIYSI